MIPHLFVLFFVGIGAFFVGIWAFFAVLFTGRYPRGAFDYLVGTLRWVLPRARLHAPDRRPVSPFSLEDDTELPVRLDVDYPERIANWRPLVQWLLIYPYLIVGSVLYWLTAILAFWKPEASAFSLSGSEAAVGTAASSAVMRSWISFLAVSRWPVEIRLSAGPDMAWTASNHTTPDRSFCLIAFVDDRLHREAPARSARRSS